jgi:glyoxylate/hydroxypyruvate reductase A
MRIAFAASVGPDERAEWLQVLRSACPQHEWLEHWHPGQAADVAVVANPPPGALQGLHGLRLVQSLWAGVERLLQDPTLPVHVPLARMVDPAMNAAMAETAAWAVLSLHRGFFDYARQQREA